MRNWLCVLMFALGCGSVSSNDVDSGVGGDTAPAGDFTLAVSAAAVNVPIAGSANVTLTVERGAGVGAITLTAANLPAHITVAFATNPLPADTNTTEVTISVAGGSAAGTSTITLTGTDGTNTHSATVDVTAQTITVTGKVASMPTNVTVGLVGKSSVTPDSSGNFTFTDVTPPYDLYTYRVASAQNLGSPTILTPSIIYYDNLTRPDPVVRAALDSSFILIGFQMTNERVLGTRSGTGNNTAPSAIAWSNGYAGSPSPEVIGTGGWDLTAQWFGTATTNVGTLFGLQWTPNANGAPDQYIGFGSAPDITLTAGNAADTTQNLTFVNPTEAGLVGTITKPTGYNAAQLQLNQQFGNTSVTLWNTTTTASAMSSIVTGTTLGKASFYATAESAAGERSSYVYPALTAATDVAFTMPAAAVLTSPAASATMIDTSSDFTIAASPGAVFVYSINTATPTRASYTVYSQATTVRIPNVAERPVPPNQSFSWSVTGYGPLTVNDAATATDVPAVFAFDFTGTKRYQTQSLTATFTSKP